MTHGEVENAIKTEARRSDSKEIEGTSYNSRLLSGITPADKKLLKEIADGKAAGKLAKAY